MARPSPTAMPRLPEPFLKWAGGKRQLLPMILPEIDRARPWKRYHEPFIGGGAVFFELARTGALGRAQPFLSDLNEGLIEVYQALAEDVGGVIAHLAKHRDRHAHDHYYAVRAAVPEDRIARAARLIYLNRTCFNGLFRVNSRGLFNVPMGRYKAPKILNEANLRACAAALQKARLAVQPFDAVLSAARPGDLVYFDPPYDPVSETANFTAYAREAFGKPEQRRLAAVMGELTAKGVKVILSNSATPFIRGLYRDYRVAIVQATRNVNRDASKRGPVDEVLVSNF